MTAIGWTLVVLGLVAMAGLWASIRSAGKYDREVDIDQGALEGDLTAYVAEQNARAGK